MKFNIFEILTELSKIRPMFHNEVDFQFYFSMLLKDKGYNIRLEYYIGTENDRRKYIDLVAYDKENNECYLFEFKYKTAEGSFIVNGEQYDFFNHGARDLGAYAVLNDVERLENQLDNTFYGVKPTKSYAIFLTNDLGYLKGFKKDSLCFNYGLIDGKIIPKNQHIKFIIPEGKTKDDTCVKKLREIRFNKDYKVIWNDYSKYLKMLILEI